MRALCTQGRNGLKLGLFLDFGVLCFERNASMCGFDHRDPLFVEQPKASSVYPDDVAAAPAN
jgi:hypothetical protein